MAQINQVTQIQTIVSSVTKVKIIDICLNSRKSEIVQARHLSMYFSRYNTQINTLEIARLHGKNNHATVLHACQAIHSERKTNKRLNEMFEQIQNQINWFKQNS
jgi:chromosomal replication initiator protein